MEVEAVESHGNPFVAPMFLTQRIAFLFFAMWGAAYLFTDPVGSPLAFQITSTMLAIALCIFWYFVFRSATWNYNVFFGTGHLVAVICLTPCLFIGVLLIPVLIRGDAERLARSDSQ